MIKYKVEGTLRESKMILEYPYVKHASLQSQILNKTLKEHRDHQIKFRRISYLRREDSLLPQKESVVRSRVLPNRLEMEMFGN